MSEFVNQWVGGLERLRWAHMEKPLRAAQGTRPPDYPRAASGQTLAAWNAAWAALRSATLLADSNAAPVPGSTLVPLETQLRGMGLNPLADRLRTAALRVDTALAGVAQADIHSGAQVQQTARALAVLKHLAESEVAPALKVSIGFSDADGD
jgi:predicted lipoprotein